MAFGLTGEGLETQSLEEVRASIVAKLQAAFGTNIETTTSSVLGQIVDIMAELHQFDQEVLAEVWASFSPNDAIGVALDRIAKITQTFREGATNSTAQARFKGTDTTIIANGSQVRLNATSTVWQVTGGPYTIGAVTPGEVDGTITAVDTGPVQALTTGPSGWTIVTPIVGWDTVETIEDADVGQDQESDKLLKQRREIELSAAAQGPLAAIKANINKISRVDLVEVYHNPKTNPIDSDGIPFKAFNVVVQTNPTTPPADLIAEIADAIWLSQGAGGEAYGTDVTTTITDTEGNIQPINFDLLAEVDMYVRVTLTTSTSEQPVTENITTVVAEGMLEAVNDRHQDPGQDVRPWELTGEVFALDLTGVDGVLVEVSDDGVVWQTTIYAIGIRQRADWDSARITVLEV